MKNKIKWFFIALTTICLLSATMIMFSGCGDKESEDTSVNAPIAGAFALENTPIHTTVNSITDMYIVSGEIQLYLDGRISSSIEAIVQGYTGSNIQTQTNIGTYSWVEGSDKINVVWNNSPNEIVIMSYYGDSLINGILTYSLTGINDIGELEGKVYQAIYDVENVTNKYNIDGGYLVGKTSQFVNKGEDASLVTAIANDGFEFDGWSDGVKESERRDRSLSGNIHVKAVFRQVEPIYLLEYSAGEGGTLEGKTSQYVVNGRSASQVVAIPEEGYEFVRWSDGVTTAERTDTAVAGDITVTAIFEKLDKYTLTYTAGLGGYIEGNESQTVQKGESGQTVTAVAYEGYEFVGWSDDVTTADRTDINVTNDITVTAIFVVLDTTHFAGGNGSKSNPYKISTIEQMNNVSLYPNAHYILINDITLPQTPQNTSNFTPLFNDETMFNGSLNGNGHTIYNLTIRNTDTFYTGLFACIGVDGSVTNLTLENVNLQGTNYIGGIAGYATGEVTDCKVSGKIIYIPQNSYNIYLGGIAGRAENNVNGCISSVEIIADGVNGETYIGGIVGYFSYGMGESKTSLTVVSSVEINLLSINEDKQIYGYLGGVFGYSSEPITLKDSSAAGNIAAEGLRYSYVGGLIGDGSSSSTFTSCYAIGNITVTDSSSWTYVGGLIGDCGINNKFSACNTSVDITTMINGDTYVGGLIGNCDGNVFTLCYAIGEINVTANSNTYIGGLIGANSYYNNTFTECYSTCNITVISDFISVGGLIGSSASGNTCISCYTTGNISVMSDDSTSVGGLIGRSNSNSNSTISNSYTTAQISFEGEAQTKYIGSIVGQAGKLTITNTHWLYFTESGVEYAVGYSSDMGIPTSIGSTKHTDIANFYTLADALNKGLETPVWENIWNSSLPTLKKENN